MNTNRSVNQPRGGTQQNTSTFSSSGLRQSMAQMNESQSQRRIFSSLQDRQTNPSTNTTFSSSTFNRQQQPSMSFTNSSRGGLTFTSHQMVISDSKLPSQHDGPTSNMRREKDVRKLLMSQYDVQLTNEDDTKDFRVIFYGPKDSPYEGGKWEVKVTLPDQYPFKSPSIGFSNKIYHPNIDEMSGSVCLDVINQTWSPMYDLLNIFEIFLPQLLLYPNPKDPLNSDAAKLLMSNETDYKKKVQDYIKKFASPTYSQNAKDDAQKSQQEKIKNFNQALGSVSANQERTSIIKRSQAEKATSLGCKQLNDNLSETSHVKLDSAGSGEEDEDENDLDELEDDVEDLEDSDGQHSEKAKTKKQVQNRRDQVASDKSERSISRSLNERKSETCKEQKSLVKRDGSGSDQDQSEANKDGSERASRKRRNAERNHLETVEFAEDFAEGDCCGVSSSGQGIKLQRIERDE